jgi:hypothetical protein
MMSAGVHDNDLPFLSQRLLLSVAEELKLPLLQIARLAEYGGQNVDVGFSTNRDIQATADTTLKLLDNYILGVRLSLEPQQFDKESISVSSVLYDAGQQLDALAKSYGVGLELDIAGKFGPVTANRRGLQAALVSLGASLIEALPALGRSNTSQLRLQLATHRSRYGIVAGVYADTKQVSAEALTSGRKLQAQSRQPLINLTHGSGAGIFVADTILKAMDLNLVTSRHHRLYGIGTVLKSNDQLQLIT